MKRNTNIHGCRSTKQSNRPLFVCWTKVVAFLVLVAVFGYFGFDCGLLFFAYIFAGALTCAQLHHFHKFMLLLCCTQQQIDTIGDLPNQRTSLVCTYAHIHGRYVNNAPSSFVRSLVHRHTHPRFCYFSEFRFSLIVIWQSLNFDNNFWHFFFLQNQNTIANNVVSYMCLYEHLGNCFYAHVHTQTLRFV